MQLNTENSVFIFDVDGTLTPSRGKMDAAMEAAFGKFIGEIRTSQMRISICERPPDPPLLIAERARFLKLDLHGACPASFPIVPCLTATP